MITAPRQYASKLAALLVAAGARPIWVPAISISHVTNPRQIQARTAFITFAFASVSEQHHQVWTTG